MSEKQEKVGSGSVNQKNKEKFYKLSSLPPSQKSISYKVRSKVKM